MYTLYMHFNRTNGKKYIGITGRSLNSRFGKDGSGYKRCAVFWNAIQKYGWDNFEHRILRTNLTEEEAKDLEKKYIAAFQTNDRRFGYNILEGGQCGPMPQETKDKIGESHKGKPNGREGTHLSEETKEKIASSQRGRKMSESHYDNFVKAMAKRKGTPGRKLSEKEIEDLRQHSVKKVLCVETGVVYESMTACAEAFGVLVSNLSRYIKQEKKYKGFHFMIVCL